MEWATFNHEKNLSQPSFNSPSPIHGEVYPRIPAEAFDRETAALLMEYLVTEYEQKLLKAMKNSRKPSKLQPLF
ncbi:hypothetical protein NZD89_20245 [Alicyclobacillus fastidiosus]|uniref:Uncharacterized protein n=1 Tax=Alicyclobacillus fastidiosus TaxID=392011 RepID=A0ABY6ZCK6_9BACL|nr:hypothetical protein [Alicyclobacillus fastidiosus]WAH40624.1 hypothetical protein NZD89_20245 [Alicyclobacillus fastidiosus]GMA62066.1 hypothetical protein GCM10025859_25060 [Alicyclobacillus fastidiosus]